MAVGAMIVAQKADAAWLAPRAEAFRTGDVARWEQALRDIRSNPLCGVARCLENTRVCQVFVDDRDDRIEAIKTTFVAIYGKSPVQVCGFFYDYF